MQSQKKPSKPIATIGVDIGKSTFHLIGQDGRGAIVTQPSCSVV